MIKYTLMITTSNTSVGIRFEFDSQEARTTFLVMFINSIKDDNVFKISLGERTFAA